ncbi:MAG: sulfite exporter TauE/SafE family protein [Clostridia bacterium]|nr:sulfite exporter TauE/SafE family protein [Clostridia bacterium]
MEYVFLAILGLCGGVFGGMGMGGGTILIPLLTVFGGVSQTEAQAANLVAFVPMASVALVIHFRKGLIEKEGLAALVFPAFITSIAGSFVAFAVGGDVLKKLFGAFLCVLALFTFFSFGRKEE